MPAMVVWWYSDFPRQLDLVTVIDGEDPWPAVTLPNNLMEGRRRTLPHACVCLGWKEGWWWCEEKEEDEDK